MTAHARGCVKKNDGILLWLLLLLLILLMLMLLLLLLLILLNGRVRLDLLSLPNIAVMMTSLFCSQVGLAGLAIAAGASV
jgi:hypothetical protein